MDTPSHGGIHPRSKIHVGNRLGTAAYNTIYGGKKAFTGPTLAGCGVAAGSKTLTVEFDLKLLAGNSANDAEFSIENGEKHVQHT
jgi:hypothetical protein